MKCQWILFILIALSVNSAQAHHSNQASFTKTPITVEGYVERLVFRNPHVVLYFNVTDKETNETVKWMAEGPAATGLRLAGWDDDTLKKGEYVRITGNAGRNNRPMVDLKNVEKVDPKTGAVILKINEHRQSTTPADPNSEDFKFPEKTANGLPNLTALWVQGGDTAPMPSFLLNEDPVFTPAGQAIQDTIQAINDPQYVKCEPAGLIRQAGFTPHPVRITQYDDRVVFQYEEYAGERVVYLDDREYDNYDENKRYLQGRYKAYYKDDALVIESDLLTSGWTGIFGNVTSDQTTVVETYTRGFDEKWGPLAHMSMVITDPVNLAEPWEIFWDKYYTVKGFTGTEHDNVQQDYEMLPVECQIPLTAE
jgi:hypothetical protein